MKGTVPEEALRQLLFVVSAVEEVLQHLRTGGESVRVGIVEQAVRGEQAPPEQGRRSETALVGVLDAAGAVEASPEDMAEPLRGTPDCGWGRPRDGWGGPRGRDRLQLPGHGNAPRAGGWMAGMRRSAVGRHRALSGLFSCSWMIA